MADHSQKDGNVAESAIDHVYVSKSINNLVDTRKVLNSASDHYPVIMAYTTTAPKKIFKKQITKRSLKNFNKEDWNKTLQSKDWSELYKTNDLEKAVEIYTQIVNSALDEIAPNKTFTIKSQYRFGITEKTKKLMKDRDNARLIAKRSSTSQKAIWMAKYKKLRNQVNSNIRNETKDFNNNRIDKANDENEVWKVAKEIINPNICSKKANKTICLNINYLKSLKCTEIVN